MFLTDLIQRRLVSLLRPWLRDEPDLEFKLGFLRSNGTVKNLSFSTSALNQLLDDSTRFRFKEVTVEELSLRVSYWSSPAFSLHIRGLQFTLSLGGDVRDEDGRVGGGVRQRKKPRDTTLEYKDQVLAGIDPEGCSLHDVIKRISNITSESWKTNLITTMLKYGRLQVEDIHFLLLPSIHNESYSSSLEFKEVILEPDYVRQTCFIIGLVGSLFWPSRKCSFQVNVRQLEFILRSTSSCTSVVMPTDISSYIMLENLVCNKFSVCFPTLRFSFSPSDIAIISAFYLLLSMESTHPRTGRQLWRIAASKISSLISTPKLSLARVLSSVRSWLHYKHSYEDILLLIGYPSNDIMKRSAVRMLSDKEYAESVKHKWVVISELEKELLPQPIAQVRQVVRYRVSESAEVEKNNSDGPDFNIWPWEIYKLLTRIWSITGNAIVIIARFLLLTQMVSFFVDHPKVDQQYKAVWDDFFMTRCMCLSVGFFSVSVSPETGVQPPRNYGPNYFLRQDLNSLHLLFDAFFLRCFDKLSESHLIFSSGDIKVVSSSVVRRGSHKDRNFLGGIPDARDILWSEPAKVFSSNVQSNDGETSVPLLKSILGTLWLQWDHICSSFRASDCKISETPSVLFEHRSSLTYQRSENHTSAFCNVTLVIGRLNCLLEYVSVLSLAVLFRQAQSAAYWAASKTGSSNVSHTLRTLSGAPGMGPNSSLESISSRIVATMSKILPQKFMQVGIVISGPKIQISPMSKESDSWLSLEIGDIELVGSDFTSSKASAVSLEQSDTLTVDEHESGDLWKLSNEIDSCQRLIFLSAYVKFNGLRAYLGRLTGNSRYQFMMLSQSTLRVNSSRKDVCSLGSMALSFSVAVHWIAPSFTALIFLDELLLLVEVVSDLWSAVAHAATHYGSQFDERYSELMKQVMSCAYAESEEIATQGLENISRASMKIHLRLKTSCELHVMNIVLFHSRRNSGKEICMPARDGVPKKHQPLDALFLYGFHAYLQQMAIKFRFASGVVELIINLSGFQSVIAKYSSEILQIYEHVDPKRLINSLDSLCEFSVKQCNLSLCLNANGRALPSEYCFPNDVDVTSADGNMRTMGNFLREMEIERSLANSNNCFCMNLVLSEVFLVESSVKNVLVSKHKSTNLEAYFTVAEQFQEIYFQLQGGCVYLDTTAVLMFVQLLNINRRWAENVCCHTAQSSDKGKDAPDGDAGLDLGRDPTQDFQQLQEAMWSQLETFNISLLNLYVVIVARDENGRLLEFVLEADFRSSLEVQNASRKLSLGIYKLSVLSEFLFETMEQQARKSPEFRLSSVTPSSSDTTFIQGDSSVNAEDGHLAHPIRGSSSGNDYFPDNSKDFFGHAVESTISISSAQNCILKELSASVVVERPLPGNGSDSLYLNQVWAGTGSVSGVNVILSLSEIQAILFAMDAFSGIRGQETRSSTIYGQFSVDQESEGSFEEKLPDGTIVALEDVYEHMFIAVEDVGSVYNLVGTIHYSLVGARALFRVKHQNPSRWRRHAHCISLVSVYAKDESGEPLRLSSRPRSDFVEMSGSSESAWTLWNILPYKPEVCDGNFALKSYDLPSKNTFYLVNKKNDQAVSFLDGVLEFVTKPGNPIKFKVFHDTISANGNLSLHSCFMGAPDTGLERNTRLNDRGLLGNAKVNILVNKVTITVVDQLLDSVEMIPLLQVSMNSAEIIVQILRTKARFMSRLELMLHYFDTYRNLWMELVHVLDFNIFYRYRYPVLDSGNVFPGVPGHLFARIKELKISLSELSLDVLLSVIGKLKLAGPFAVRSSGIFASCCKIENKSGATVLCKFFDTQYASVAGRKSTAIFFKNLSLANQPLEALVFSVQLTNEGGLYTSPVHLSLSEARAFAWRTRVVSSEGSKTYPGPFIVAEVSQKSEDGLSVIVSPVLRVHNETDFSMELRFQRPKQKETEFASILLKAGDSFDDSVAAFGATSLSGGSKKALISLSVGNFLLSFRPSITDELLNSDLVSVEWSDELKGGKPVCLSGVFDRLSYQVRTALSVECARCTLSTAHCVLRSEGGRVSHIFFLVQRVGKDVPVIQPDDFDIATINKNSPVALQEQKEIFLLPTVRVRNLLHTEIHVVLTDEDPRTKRDYDSLCSQATISCGTSVNLYANPATIYFTVTLSEFGSTCRPVNSSDWVKKLQKHRNKTRHLDIELDFGGGKYSVVLRLTCSNRGVLEALLFTSYSLRNDTDFALCFSSSTHKLISRKDEVGEKLQSVIPPEIGFHLPPKSTKSWFMNNKVHVKLVDEKASEALLDLDALSGLTEIDLPMEEKSGDMILTKLGVSLKPSLSRSIPSQLVSFSSRHVVLNHSEEIIYVRQCCLKDDSEEIITVNSGQRVALKLQRTVREHGEMTITERLLRKHAKSLDDPLFLFQFRLNRPAFGWSGPVCITSLGQFFLKFRKSVWSETQPHQITSDDVQMCEFAAVHIIEDDSALVLHFYMPSNVNLPYQIQNCLPHASITYYQKGSLQPDILGSGCNTNYAWDDPTLPHKLVVQVDGLHGLHEINLDKVRAWKPFHRTKAPVRMGFLPDKKAVEKIKPYYAQLIGEGSVNLGYEVYAEGLTRVLRICEFSDGHKGDTMFRSNTKMRFRISYSALQLLEFAKQEKDQAEPSIYTPIIVTKLENFDVHSMLTDRHKVNQISLQSLTMDQKWIGAPFSSVICKHQSEYSDTNDKVLQVVLILLSSGSTVKQVKHLSIILQPLNLNLDEETLMRLVPFWRSSLSDPSVPSQRYYFNQFEIHPIKIVASFLPRDAYANYTSSQEMLRSLLHSVIKIPTIRNMTVELNGVLVQHALLTLRDLSFKCAQHYSWYALRAVYIAKGSSLLPPTLGSIFDDFASSSLDAFFDPSSGVINLPRFTMGTFKLLSKCIDDKGFSGTKRYFGDLGKTLKSAGSNVLFAAITEISDSVLKGSETNGFDGMMRGFHQGILQLAMEPSLLGSAFMEGGPTRKIRLDRTPGVDELYVEGYLQALLDTLYKQEYLRVRVIENQVILKNLPPSSSLINEIMERVKGFLVSKGLLKGDSSMASRSLRRIRGETEWRIGPTLLTLCEHLFVSFAIRALRKQAGKFTSKVRLTSRLRWKKEPDSDRVETAPTSSDKKLKLKPAWRWGVGKFVFSCIVAYVDGRLCRSIPNPIARRVVSGFLLSFLEDEKD